MPRGGKGRRQVRPIIDAPQNDHSEKVAKEQLERLPPSQQQQLQQPQRQPADETKPGEFDWLLALAEAAADADSPVGQEETTEEAHKNDEQKPHVSGETTQHFFIGDWCPSARGDWADLQDSDTECQYTYTYHNISDDSFGGERDQNAGDMKGYSGEDAGIRGCPTSLEGASFMYKDIGDQKGYLGDDADFHGLDGPRKQGGETKSHSHKNIGGMKGYSGDDACTRFLRSTVGEDESSTHTNIGDQKGYSGDDAGRLNQCGEVESSKVTNIGDKKGYSGDESLMHKDIGDQKGYLGDDSGSHGLGGPGTQCGETKSHLHSDIGGMQGFSGDDARTCSRSTVGEGENHMHMNMGDQKGYSGDDAGQLLNQCGVESSKVTNIGDKKGYLGDESFTHKAIGDQKGYLGDDSGSRGLDGPRKQCGVTKNHSHKDIGGMKGYSGDDAGTGSRSAVREGENHMHKNNGDQKGYSDDDAGWLQNQCGVESFKVKYLGDKKGYLGDGSLSHVERSNQFGEVESHLHMDSGDCKGSSVDDEGIRSTPRRDSEVDGPRHKNIGDRKGYLGVDAGFHGLQNGLLNQCGETQNHLHKDNIGDKKCYSGDDVVSHEVGSTPFGVTESHLHKDIGHQKGYSGDDVGYSPPFGPLRIFSRMANVIAYGQERGDSSDTITKVLQSIINLGIRTGQLPPGHPCTAALRELERALDDCSRSSSSSSRGSTSRSSRTANKYDGDHI